MKKLLLVITTLMGTYAFAQQTAKAEITLVKQVDQTIEFTISSTKKFQVGGNIHVLHIGNTVFKHNKQGASNGKSTITFLIPLNEFNALVDGGDLWMSYGNKLKVTDQKLDIKHMCEASPASCWYLGTFNKNILKK